VPELDDMTDESERYSDKCTRPPVEGMAPSSAQDTGPEGETGADTWGKTLSDDEFSRALSRILRGSGARVDRVSG
jgi:hypothetical protein